jgi:hypothetical protein
VDAEIRARFSSVREVCEHERQTLEITDDSSSNASLMSLAESQLALAALASLCAGERDAIGLLRQVVWV